MRNVLFAVFFVLTFAACDTGNITVNGTPDGGITSIVVPPYTYTYTDLLLGHRLVVFTPQGNNQFSTGIVTLEAGTVPTDVVFRYANISNPFYDLDQTPVLPENGPNDCKITLHLTMEDTVKRQFEASSFTPSCRSMTNNAGLAVVINSLVLVQSVQYPNQFTLTSNYTRTYAGAPPETINYSAVEAH